MKINKFISIGENIHCTRVYRTTGKNVKKKEWGWSIEFRDREGEIKYLPITDSYINSSDWQDGKVRHCAIAIELGLYGNQKERELAEEYIATLTVKQIEKGANFIDINVDQFSPSLEEQKKAMQWLIDVVSSYSSIPLSIDSSNIKLLETGLERSSKYNIKTLLNSVSLERPEGIEIAVKYNAAVIASASSGSGLPSNVEERIRNLTKIYEILQRYGFKDNDIYIDPLVLPVAVNNYNGIYFLESVKAIRNKFGPNVHIAGGLSNISFGMPARALLNLVFTYLAIEAGADGGIVDPLQVNMETLNSIDKDSDKFKLAFDVLTGKDEFGLNYITVMRECI